MDNEDLNTSYPGFIYNFDSTDQTAEIQIAIETLCIGLESGYTTATKHRLSKVPVQFFRGGGWSMTCPVPDGTPCYIHFAQRGIDHWLMEGKDKAGMLQGRPAPEFGQRYSYNNAVAVIGINPVTSPISNFSEDGMELRNAEHNQVISLKGDGTINIESGSTSISISKDGDITATTTSTATVKAEAIKLDGDVTATKSLTVMGESNLNGGVNAKGGSGEASLNITGKMEITQTINGVQIETHQHPYDWTDGGGSSDTQAPIAPQ